MFCMLILSIFSSVFLRQTSSKPTESFNNVINNDGLGNSFFRYETRDGTLREETVKVSNKSLKNEQIVISGFYSYLDPKGTKHYVSYISDDRGFRPTVFFGEILLEPHISSVAIGTLQGGGLG